MNDQDLLRYSRQIILPEVGIEGQQALLDSTMLLIGVGGWVRHLPCILQQQEWDTLSLRILTR